MTTASKRDSPRNVIIVGATSGIARPLGRRLAVRGWNLVVTGRDSARLAPLADDLRVRGSGTVATLVLDPFDGPAVADGLTWVQAVRGAVGSAVFDITIDGVPMNVRPRVWWE